MKQSTLPHIGDTIEFYRVQYYWRQIPNKLEVEIELINFYKSKIIDCNDGAYHIFVAIALQDLKELNLEKGDIFIIHIPYRTFLVGLQSTDIQYRKQISRDMKNDNVRIKFLKSNKRIMDIKYIERIAEDPEMSKRADDLFYNPKQLFKKGE